MMIVKTFQTQKHSYVGDEEYSGKKTLLRIHRVALDNNDWN